MTVSTEIVAHSYFPGAAMVAEAIPFPFLDADNLAVSIEGGSDQVLGADYSISGDGRTKTGKITTLRAFADGEKLVIVRRTSRRQEVETEAFKPLPAEGVGRELDRQAMIDQEQDDVLTRVPVAPREGGVAGLFPFVLPDGSFGWSHGTGTDAGLRQDMADPALGAGLSAFRQTASYVPGTVGDKLQFFVSVKDFGAVGDGTTDDTAAFRLAIAFVLSSPKTRRLLIPSVEIGYRLTEALQINGSLAIAGEGCIPYAGNNGPSGTQGPGSWLLFDHLDTGLSFGTGSPIAGVVIRDVGFQRPQQPAPGSTAWTPVDHGYDVALRSTDAVLDNLMFLGTARGIRAFDGNYGRLNANNIFGHFFIEGMNIDKQYDLCQINNFRAWPYWSGNGHVADYTSEHRTSIVLGRVDNPQFTNIFSLGHAKGIAIDRTPTEGDYQGGSVSKGKFANVDLDAGGVGIYVSPNVVTCDLDFLNLSIQGVDGDEISHGIQIEGDNARIGITHFDARNFRGNAIRCSGVSGNNVTIGGRILVSGYNNEPDSSFPAFEFSGGNTLKVTSWPTIEFGNGAPTYGGGGTFQTLEGYGGDLTALQEAVALRASTDALASSGSAATGAGMIGFSHARNYAAGTVGNHLKRFVCVTDLPYAAKGDNATDDTAAIQAAVDAVAAGGGGTIWIPRGIYKLSSEIHITNHRTTLVGDGIDLTVLRQSGATDNGVNFDFPISFGHPTGGGLRDLTIESGAGLVAGSFWGDGSTGIGVRVSNASDNFTVERISITNFAKCSQLLHCWNTTWLNYRFAFFANVGMEIDRNSDGIGGSNRIGIAKVSNDGYAGASTTAVGLRVLSSGGEFFSTIDHTRMRHAVLVAPSGGNQVAYLHFHCVLADTSANDGWVIDGSQGIVAGLTMTDCWAGFNSGTGVYIFGAGVDSVRWSEGACRENMQAGIAIASGAKNVSFNGVAIASNSRGNPQIHPGVSIGANVDGWKVKNSRIGNFASAYSDQGDGIYVAAGASNDFEIVGNDLRGWGTGKQAINIVGSYSRAIIENNIPVFLRPVVTYYFAAGASGSGLSAASPASPTVARDLLYAAALDRRGEYRLQEVGPGTHTLTDPFLALGNAHCASQITVVFDAGSIVQGVVNGEGKRTAQFAQVTDSACLIIEQNGCLIRTFDAVGRATRGGKIILRNSRVRDCVRVLSTGYGGRVGCNTILDWDGRDLTDTVIPDSNAILLTIGSTGDFERTAYSVDPNIHHYARGPVLSEGSSGHLDFLTIADCPIGHERGRGSGAPNMIPIRFRRCPIAILSGDPTLLVSPTDWNNAFGIGTADECGTPIILHTGGGLIPATVEAGYDNRPYWSGNTLGLQGTITADTTERTVWTPLYVLPKGARAGDHIDIMDEYVFASNLAAGTVTMRLKAGATILATVELPQGTTWAVARARIYWDHDAYSVSGHLEISCAAADKSISSFGDRIIVSGAGANAFLSTSPVPVIMTMQLANGADSFRKINSTLHLTVAGTRTIV